MQHHHKYFSLYLCCIGIFVAYGAFRKESFNECQQISYEFNARMRNFSGGTLKKKKWNEEEKLKAQTLKLRSSININPSADVYAFV